MIPIPAIDLKDGQVVRLFQGNFQAVTVYAQSPEGMARYFEQEGAARLHVVDLDGALKGKPANRLSVEKILREIKIPVELGGGIRDLKTAETYFEMGVRWAIVGTKACLDPGFAREALREFGEKIIFGIDAREGFVATDGWTKVTPHKAVDFALSLQALGARCVIYTDISKDGALKGPNLSEIRRMAEAVSLDVIASGGIGQAQDLKALSALRLANVSGVVIGKALYEGKFRFAEAMKACLPSA